VALGERLTVTVFSPSESSSSLMISTAVVLGLSGMGVDGSANCGAGEAARRVLAGAGTVMV